MPLQFYLVTHDRSELDRLKVVCDSLYGELQAIAPGIQVIAAYDPPIHTPKNQESQEVVIGPPPDESLGKRLESVEEVREWLSHPSNWVDTKLFIIKWDNNVPKIAREFVRELSRESFCSVVIREQKNRKRRPVNVDPFSMEEIV